MNNRYKHHNSGMKGKSYCIIKLNMINYTIDLLETVINQWLQAIGLLLFLFYFDITIYGYGIINLAKYD